MQLPAMHELGGGGMTEPVDDRLIGLMGTAWDKAKAAIEAEQAGKVSAVDAGRDCSEADGARVASPVDGAKFVSAGLLYHLLPHGMTFDDTGLLSACSYRNLNQPSVQDLGASHILADHAFFSGLNDLRMGRMDAALSRGKAEERKGRGSKEIFNNIGSALAEHGQADQAISYLEQAASLDARYTLPRWNLFRLARERERWGRACDRLADIIRADPAEYRAHAEMGFLLDGIFGDAAGAIRHWQQSLRLNSDQPQVISALAKQTSPDFR